MKKSLLFISLDEAHHICDKAQYEEATGWERFKLKLRYTWCRFTRNYIKKNTLLTETFQNNELHFLKPEEINSFKKEFDLALENNREN